jgi:hypothetical protein
LAAEVLEKEERLAVAMQEQSAVLDEVEATRGELMRE